MKIESTENKTDQLTTDFDGVSVFMIGLSDLIKNKRASGRLQDLADIEKMTLSQNIKDKLED